ncbi:MAG: tetratricopeptide repeat protein [Candidatus Omnitrophica bacterium]|nr:tetratricopeptide repeat protein [Candidatus Omnitrophota bacterium]MDD5430166.1 tetratricopeptide repeat protein [Candidatus Omnitrophota bacterium]
MKTKTFFKHFYPLIIAFFAAVVFFLSYNHYLLDKSFVNLKISVKKLTAKTLPDIREIEAILDDTYIMELAAADLNTMFMAEINFGNVIVQKATNKDQLDIARSFLESAVGKKKKARPVLLRALDSFSATIFPFGRKENASLLEKKISRLRKDIGIYKGKPLQLKYLEIARLYIGLKDWDNAVAYLKKVIQITGDSQVSSLGMLYLGLVNMETGKYSEAIEMFNKIKGKLPEKIDEFVFYQEGVCFYNEGSSQEAAARFEKAFIKRPSSELNQLAQFRAGYIYLYDIKDGFKAYKAFIQISELAPLSKLGMFAKETMLPLVSKLYRDKGFNHLYEGYKFLKESKFEEALEQFNLALKIYPLDALAYSGKGLAFYFLKKPEEALSEGRKSKELGSRNADVLANLGFLYYSLGMIDEAIIELQEAVKVKPKVDVFHYDLGTLYLLEKEYKKAKKQFKEAININPDFAYARNNLGYILWLEQNYSEAKGFLERAISLNPQYIEACYNLGVVLYSLGNYEEAKEKFLYVEQLGVAYRRTKWYLQEIKKMLGY